MSNPAFDSIVHTQSGLPDLMELLLSEYARYLEKELKQRKKAGQKAPDTAAAMKRAPATHFVSFCRKYLEANRPVEVFALDENYGIRLSNNVRVAVSPGMAVEGSMQESGAVAVTEGRSQPGQGGVERSTEIRI